jgi:phage major head subunit gpT-like protein
MLISEALIRSIFTGYSAVFQRGLDGARSHYRKIAMVVPSSTRENHYGWLSALPSMREWIGDRVVYGLDASDFILKNLEFEATVAVKRKDIEDDQAGVYSPLFEKMGRDAGLHPDKLTLSLLKNGFSSLCYDGQFFFDTDHPVGGTGDAPVVSVSNSGGGSGAAWFLLDCSQMLKPLLFQERLPYQITRLDRDTDENVFSRGQYLYGVRARCNAGYGLWQLAYGSKQPLNDTNYAAARAAMMSFRQDNGEPLNVTPTHLVVPPALEAAALQVVNADRNAAGAANIWQGTAELVVSPYVV